MSFNEILIWGVIAGAGLIAVSMLGLILTYIRDKKQTPKDSRAHITFRDVEGERVTTLNVYREMEDVEDIYVAFEEAIETLREDPAVSESDFNLAIDSYRKFIEREAVKRSA